MRELRIAKLLLHKFRSERPAAWWEAFRPTVLREEGGAVVVDTAHPAYAKAAAEFGPLFQWHGKSNGPSSSAATAARRPAARDPRSLLWLELHRRPLESTDLRKEGAWLTAFAAIVPCGDCRKHWKELTSRHPPDFEAWAAAPAGRMAYARWTWMIHNAVNAMLKKPEISWEQAIDWHGWESIAKPLKTA